MPASLRSQPRGTARNDPRRRLPLVALGCLTLVVGCLGEPARRSPDASSGRDASRDAGADIEWPDAGDPWDSGQDLPDAGSADAAAQDASNPTTPIDEYWARTLWPPYATLRPGERVAVYGQVEIPGGTDRPGPMVGLRGEVGHGPAGSDPAAGGWTWERASFHEDVGEIDELIAELVAPAAGPRDFTFRYRIAGSHWSGRGEWLYAGLKGPDYSSQAAGKLVVREAGASIRIATLNLHCLRDDPKARLQTAAKRFIALGVDVVALQEVCQDTSPQPLFGDSAVYLAQLLAAGGRTWTARFEQTHLNNDEIPEGLGLVSAFPIMFTSVCELPTADFPRKALLALLATPAGAVAVTSTQLSFSRDAAAKRVEQVQKLLALANEWQGKGQPPGTLVVVAGDFNADPGEQAIQTMKATFTDAWGAAHPGDPGFTFPSSGPNARIDYVFASAPSGSSAAVLEATGEFAEPYSGTAFVSDHIGLVTRLTVGP